MKYKVSLKSEHYWRVINWNTWFRLYNRAIRKTTNKPLLALHCVRVWVTVLTFGNITFVAVAELLSDNSLKQVWWFSGGGWITHCFGVCASPILFECVVAWCACEGRTSPWKQANRGFGVTCSAVCIGAAGCFSQGKDRCYSSLVSQSAQGSEVTAITALQREAFRIRKLTKEVFGVFDAVATWETFFLKLKFYLFFLPLWWLRFYWIVWAMSTKTISSKC